MKNALLICALLWGSISFGQESESQKKFSALRTIKYKTTLTDKNLEKAKAIILENTEGYTQFDLDDKYWNYIVDIDDEHYFKLSIKRKFNAHRMKIGYILRIRYTYVNEEDELLNKLIKEIQELK